jgi:hypothetical protein
MILGISGDNVWKLELWGLLYGSMRFGNCCDQDIVVCIVWLQQNFGYYCILLTLDWNLELDITIMVYKRPKAILLAMCNAYNGSEDKPQRSNNY